MPSIVFCLLESGVCCGQSCKAVKTWTPQRRRFSFPTSSSLLIIIRNWTMVVAMQFLDTYGFRIIVHIWVAYGNWRRSDQTGPDHFMLRVFYFEDLFGLWVLHCQQKKWSPSWWTFCQRQSRKPHGEHLGIAWGLKVDTFWNFDMFDIRLTVSSKPIQFFW